MRNDGLAAVGLRLKQAAQRAARLDRPVADRFVTGAERHQAVHEAREAGVEASFSGGWADAERVQVCFHPPQDEPVFTAVWLEVRWPVRFVQVEHRDLLGSLMGLGMDRSFFGDLHCHGKDAFRFYTESKCVTTRWFDEEEMKRERVDTWDGSL